MIDLILEIVLSGLGEYLLLEWVSRFPGPVLSVAGSAILGGLYGGLSLLFAPRYLIHNPSVRFLYVALVPVALGIVMACIGAWRASREKQFFRFDYFAYAYIFALVFVLARAAGVQ